MDQLQNMPLYREGTLGQLSWTTTKQLISKKENFKFPSFEISSFKGVNRAIANPGLGQLSWTTTKQPISKKGNFKFPSFETPSFKGVNRAIANPGCPPDIDAFFGENAVTVGSSNGRKTLKSTKNGVSMRTPQCAYPEPHTPVNPGTTQF